MSIWSLLFEKAFIYGLALSLVLTAITTISGTIVPDMWVGKYPPDIRQKYGPMSPRAARLRTYVVAAIFTAVLVIPILGLLALRAEVNYVPFIPSLVFSFATLLVFNVFDLIFLDWLLFCTIQPRLMVLPGTEGMPGYRDYRFHFIGFLKGFGFCAVGALLITALWMVAQWLIF